MDNKVLESYKMLATKLWKYWEYFLSDLLSLAIEIKKKNFLGFNFGVQFPNMNKFPKHVHNIALSVFRFQSIIKKYPPLIQSAFTLREIFVTSKS